MPKLTYQDMTVSISALGGDFHIQLRTLDEKLSPAQLAALLYPIFDAKEKQKV